jgi:hypothetical protein
MAPATASLRSNGTMPHGQLETDNLTPVYLVTYNDRDRHDLHHSAAISEEEDPA